MIQAAVLALTLGNFLRIAVATALGGMGSQSSDERIDLVRASLAGGTALLPPGDFPGSLAALLRNSMDDPCSAAHFMQLDGPRNFGFGARLSVLINDVLLSTYAIALGQSSATWAICWINTGGVRDTWNDLFYMVPECLDPSRCAPRLGDFASDWSLLVNDVETKFGQDGARIISEERAYILSIVAAYKPATENWLADGRRSLGLGGKPYIGVHIRHGDKFLEAPPVDIRKYADQILDVPDVPGGINFLQTARQKAGTLLSSKSDTASSLALLASRVLQEADRRAISKVFLASDDSNALQVMRDYLDNRLAVVSLPRLDQSTYTYRPYEDRLTLQALLADISLLSQSDFFIGTGSSNVGRIVFLRRGGDLETSLSMDVPFTGA